MSFCEKLEKMALTLTFLCVIIYNRTSIGKLRDFDLFEVLILQKEQKKNNLKGKKSTADTRCYSKGVIAFYGARGSTGEALQAHELLAHR